MAFIKNAVLITAAFTIFSSISAAPLPQGGPNPGDGSITDMNSPFKLYTVAMYARSNGDSAIGTAVDQAKVANASFTPLTFQQPSGPATNGQRFLAATTSLDSAIPATVSGGYIRAELPIPRSNPPATASWSSINDDAFGSDEAEPVGGQVMFTTENEGADGGIMVDPDNNALFLHEVDNNDYNIWKLCGAEDEVKYLAFAGSSNDQTCAPVYLFGIN